LSPSRRRGLTTCLILSLIASGSSGCRGRTGPAGDRQTTESRATPTSALPFNLYFPTVDGTLRGVRRTLEVTQDPAQRVRVLLQALLAGPREEGLLAPFEYDTEIAATLLSPTGVVYVDLRSPGHPEPPSLGSRDELLTVYSLVNTAVLNVPEARRVVLLWNGVQRPSFAGHVDTGHPLRLRIDLEAS